MRDRVFAIVSRVMGVPVEQVTEESSPETMTQWDSLRHMNLLLSLEEELDIRFTDQEMSEMMGLRKILELLENRVRT